MIGAEAVPTISNILGTPSLPLLITTNHYERHTMNITYEGQPRDYEDLAWIIETLTPWALAYAADQTEHSSQNQEFADALLSWNRHDVILYLNTNPPLPADVPYPDTFSGHWLEIDGYATFAMPIYRGDDDAPELDIP